MADGLVAPVLTKDEAQGGLIAARWVLKHIDLGAEDGAKIRGFLEGMARAPELDAGEVDQNRLGRFRKDGGATSRAAAIMVTPRTGTQRYRVLAHIGLATGRDGTRLGRTRDELARYLEMPISTVNPRCRELLDGGFIEAAVYGDGEPITRKTRTRSAAEVLVVSGKGLAALRVGQR